MVISQGLVLESQNFLSNALSDVEIMLAVGQNFWLNNWNDAVLKYPREFAVIVHLQSNRRRSYKAHLLADDSVSGQDVGVLKHSKVGRCPVLNFEDATPLGKVATPSLVFSTPITQIIQTLGGAFVKGSAQGTNTSIDLDSWNNSSFL